MPVPCFPLFEVGLAENSHCQPAFRSAFRKSGILLWMMMMMMMMMMMVMVMVMMMCMYNVYIHT